MEKDPRRNDYRKAMRRREFGPSPVCTLCGETDPVRFHHIGGRANDLDLEAPVCSNCHLRAHEELRHYGVDLRHQPKTVIERIEAVLRGLAAFFRQLSERLAEWAEALAALVRALNEHLPGWKNLKEAW